MTRLRVYPILLAAGPSPRLGLLMPLAVFGKKTAIEIAVQNCAGLEKPIVVLGYGAAQIRRRVPRGARVIVNRNWRAGQLSSLRAGLRAIPINGAFLIYPVDHVLLNRRIIRQFVRAYRNRSSGKTIVMPRCGRRAGHPVLCAPEVREELRRARTAREVVYRDQHRIHYVSVASHAIWLDFNTPASCARLQKMFCQRKG